MLQAAALVVIAAIVLVKTVIGHPDNVGRALLDALLALFGAAVLAACARGLMPPAPGRALAGRRHRATDRSR